LPSASSSLRIIALVCADPRTRTLGPWLAIASPNFALPTAAEKAALGCPGFRGHRDRCHTETGGRP
jgi:hypothetical protein